MCVCTVTKALEQNKQRTQKQLSQNALAPTEQPEAPSAGRIRSSQSSDGPDGSPGSINSPTFSASPVQSSDSTARELEPGEMFNHCNWFPLFLSLSLFRTTLEFNTMFFFPPHIVHQALLPCQHYPDSERSVLRLKDRTRLPQARTLTSPPILRTIFKRRSQKQTGGAVQSASSDSFSALHIAGTKGRQCCAYFWFSAWQPS